SYLGFRPFFDEWKVMGMSAYGRPTYVKDFEDVVHLTPDGGYRLNLSYFQFHTHGQSQWLSPKFLKKFGPPRQHNGPYDQHHFDMAFALQRIVERTGVAMAAHLQAITGSKNLCMSGGVVLNCLMNKRIVEETHFKNFFFQPIANDAGTSFGSALYYYHHVLGKPRENIFESAYLGNEFTNEEIEKVLKAKGLQYRRVANIAAETASRIAKGKIVGWFQGRMEAGPRALGNRSITVDPRDAMMKDRLNARVKKREFYRPFAPSVLEERVADYFIMPKGQPSPYMILIGDVREDKKHVIPAVTHADGTARVHTVSRQINPRYWDLIAEFEKLTGVAVLINTSFNENEPIVCTPEHAADCFLRTEFDVLSIGDFLVEKNSSS
ncbi:MAG: carbamoyl transferase, partial [Candidatus Omnitrophica bacterium]|nr:carbamoyl transferase [Candidatus Omnitrophota bacterium]